MARASRRRIGTRRCALFLSLPVLEASAVEDKETAATHESAVEDQVADVDDQVSALEPEAKDPEGRFRFGISAMGGPMTGAYEGGAGGLDVRLGYQFNNTLGLYAQPVGLVGAGGSIHMDGARASGLALTGVGFLLEVTP